MHHHTIQIIQQKDATVLKVCHLTFMCGSTCFESIAARHQEHITALGASGLTAGENRLERCWSGRFSPTVKPEASSAVVCS
jgi:hypothetical protein